jgi:hypothetical protein
MQSPFRACFQGKCSCARPAAERDVGELLGGWLALAATAEGRVLWCAGVGNAPTGLRPRYVTKDAFTAMRDGAIAQDGALFWNGRRYALADVAEGARQVTRLVSEGEAA